MSASRGIRALASLLASLVPWAGCAPAAGTGRPEIAVYAAVSLREPLAAMAPRWEGAAGATMVFNFGASNDLARQILAARAADLFLSADEAQMDVVERAGLVTPGTRDIFLSNRLVVVVPAGGAPQSWREVVSSGDAPISVADPESVPAGRYAKAWLESNGYWARVAPRVVPGVDARAALAAVESEAAQAGIVYRTDALLSRRVRVVHEVSGDDGPRILYVAAAVAGRPHPAQARAALRYLHDEEARAFFEKRGFVIPGRCPRPDVPGPPPAGASMSAHALAALLVSLKVAFCATALVLPAGFLIGWWLARREFPGKVLVETVVSLPLVLPPTAVGYVLLSLFAFHGPLGAGALGIDLGVLLTWRGAVAASAVMSLPLVSRTARVAFEAVDPRLEAMGRTLGFGPVATFLRITRPLARRGLLASAVLGFSRALGEFGATVIVAGNIPGRTQTLALAIFSDIQSGRNEEARVLLAITTLLAFAGIYATEALLKRPGEARAGGTKP